MPTTLTALFAISTMPLRWLTDLFMKKRECGTEETLYRIGLAAALVAAAGCLLWQWVPRELRDWLERYSFCVIYRFTGFICPGCGGTRALTALLQGHVLESILYHPLVLYGVVLYVCFMGSHTLAKMDAWLTVRCEKAQQVGSQNGRWRMAGMKWKNGYVYGAVALLLGNFIIKNLIHLITGMDVLAELGQLFV